MIDAELAEFLQGGVGIHLGTRNQHLQPNGARVAAITVEPDGVHVVVYLPKVAARRVLPDLEANGQAAVVVARPIDDRSCQLKGVFVGSRPARKTEQALVDTQWEKLLAALEQIGIPRVALGGWVTWPAVAVRLRTTAVFDQTPGPVAGAQLA